MQNNTSTGAGGRSWCFRLAVVSSLFHTCSLAGAADDGPESASDPVSSFTEVGDDFPESVVWQPEPEAPPPVGSRGLVFDNFDNFWIIGPTDANGNRRPLVLPGQDPSAWIDPDVGGLEPGPWLWMVPDEHGCLWIASSRNLLCLDPRFPLRGWQSCSADSNFPSGLITALGVGPRGSMLAALDSGLLVEIDRLQKRPDGERVQNAIATAACPRPVDRLTADGQGRVWLQVDGKTFRSKGDLFDQREDGERTPSAGDHQGHWKLVARMPGCNHDLSGDVLNGRFYVGGGLTNGWGFPAKDHDFSQLFEFDSRTMSWRIAGELGRGRVFCTTSHLDGKVWVIGGDVFEQDGTRREMDWVQIVDPATGTVTNGPPTRIPRPTPVAAHINGRIYVVGNSRDRNDEPGQIESIGPGETQWRQEPDGPAGFGALAGCALDNCLYVALPEQFLAVFDTATRMWSRIDVPHPPRSCQMAAFRGRIWLMGGRNVPGGSATQIYDPQSREWRVGPALPRELSWGAATAVDGRLIVAGGAGQHGTDWSYNNRTWVFSE